MDYTKTKLSRLGIKVPLALAPMAGTTETVFRQLCLEQGAGLVVTELVSARGLVYDHDFSRSKRYLDFALSEKPLAIQLFGSDPTDFQQAVKLLCEHSHYGNCSFIDINMGCPVPKVVKQQAGAALMKNPDLAYAVMATTVEQAAKYGKSVSVKIRSGWDRDCLNAVPIAQLAERAGVAMITVHARTREQFYSGNADYRQIERVKQAVSIPVWGNGDVKDFDSYQRMLETGCDGVMIGRGAQGRPWVFSEILKKSTVSADTKKQIIAKHVEGLIEQRGEYTGLREFRSQLAFYTKGLKHSAKLRSEIFRITDIAVLLTKLEQIDFTDDK